jgi:hypothetical protein
LRVIGTVACLFAIFFSAGGHWAVLQSIAYSRMLVQFAQEDSWCTAVEKTFDSRYACPLCPKIRDGYNKERKAPPTVSGGHLPEFVAQSGFFFCFAPAAVTDVPFLPPLHADFYTVPPKPPPRVV